MSFEQFGMIGIHARRDRCTEVWIAESDEFPGWTARAGSLEELFATLRLQIPQLIEFNDLRDKKGRRPSCDVEICWSDESTGIQMLGGLRLQSEAKGTVTTATPPKRKQ